MKSILQIKKQLSRYRTLFENIALKMPLIAEHFSSISLDKAIIPKNFLPTNIDSFYRYQGSLTTPNCNEVVSWTIFSQPAAITKPQVTSCPNVNYFNHISFFF